MVQAATIEVPVVAGRGFGQFLRALDRLGQTLGRLSRVMDQLVTAMRDIGSILVRNMRIAGRTVTVAMSAMASVLGNVIQKAQQQQQLLLDYRERADQLVDLTGRMSQAMESLSGVIRRLRADLQQTAQAMTRVIVSTSDLRRQVTSLDSFYRRLGLSLTDLQDPMQAVTTESMRAYQSFNDVRNVFQRLQLENRGLSSSFTTLRQAIDSNVVAVEDYLIDFTQLNEAIDKINRQFEQQNTKMGKIRQVYQRFKEEVTGAVLGLGLMFGVLFRLAKFSPFFQAQMSMLNVELFRLGVIVGDALAPALELLANLVQGLVDWYNSLPEPAQRFIDVVLLLTAAIAGLSLAFLILNASTAQYVLLIVAIAAVIAILIVALEELLKALGFEIDIIQLFIDIITFLWNLLLDFVKFLIEVPGYFLLGIQLIFQGISGIITGTIDFIIDVVTGIIDLIVFLITALVDILMDIPGAIMAVVDGIVMIFTGFFEAMSLTLGWLADLIADFVEGVIISMADFAGLAVGAVVNFFSGFVEAFFDSVTVFSSLIGELVGIVDQAFQDILGFSLKDTIKTLLTPVGWIWDLLAGSINIVVDAFNSVAEPLNLPTLDRIPMWVDIIGSFDTGGPVPRTGMALVHSGEYVVPRGGDLVLRSEGGGSSGNFSNVSINIILNGAGAGGGFVDTAGVELFATQLRAELERRGVV